MSQVNKNKELVLEYLNSLSGVTKTPEGLSRFVDDEELRNHILFFDAVLPKYEFIADEMTAEGDRVVLKARVKGRHEGEFNGIPPTHKQVEFGVAICYTIENNKIVNHWMIADLATLMEQLGVANLETA
jgi:predicted ester cyclase